MSDKKKSKFNPYEILNVDKNADQNTITKSHRKLILKWHPDKFKPVSTNEREQEKELVYAKEMYEKISKSNEILSDPEKKSKYDKYGIIDQNDEQEMAEQMAREMIIKEKLKEVIRLDITISELLNGVNKPLTIQRQIIQRNMRMVENLTIQLDIDSTIPVNKPIIFEGKGKKVNNDCGDLFIMLNIKSDSSYKLDNSTYNIITTQKISLIQSLCGFEMSIPFNKKNLLIQYDNIIKQNYSYFIKNMGLTISDDNDQLKKTNIEIIFDIQYPSKIEENTIKDLRTVFKYNYKKSESAPNKEIVILNERKTEIKSNDNDENLKSINGIGIEQLFGMGGIPGMDGFNMGGMNMGGMNMGGIPGMPSFMGNMPGMPGMSGMNMGGRNRTSQKVHVQECNQS